MGANCPAKETDESRSQCTGPIPERWQSRGGTAADIHSKDATMFQPIRVRVQLTQEGVHILAMNMLIVADIHRKITVMNTLCLTKWD